MLGEERTIFDNIHRRAKEKGLSVNEVEKKAGIGVGSTYKWDKSSPTVRNISKVAEVLECSVEDLISTE